MKDDDDDDADAVPPSAYRPYLPYTLAIRDSIMIAHSFHGHPLFGPAGGMHGATYTVDVEFAARGLHPVCNWVIDIGVASELVAEVLGRYNCKNLDEVFGDGVMTTTEFMCRAVFDGVVEKLKERNGADGDDGGGGFSGWIKVLLWESHKAWASFEGPCI
jgi:6-pyruvoyltetrahydropterin/6-carboxytetrahydropterin synthase